MRKVMLAAAVAAVLTAAPAGAQEKRAASLTPRGATGRYQMTCQAATNDVLGSCYLLDTVSGRV